MFVDKVFFNFLTFNLISSSICSIEDVVKDVFIAIWLELVSLTLVEFVLELDPMETKSMQEALEQIHAHENCKGDGPENWPQDNTLKNMSKIIKLTKAMVTPTLPVM